MWNPGLAKDLLSGHFGISDVGINIGNCLMPSLPSLYLVSMKEDTYSEEEPPEKKKLIFSSNRNLF